MLQISVCIELIFTDRDFLDRIDAVAEADLPAFEFWGWRDKDLTAIVERQKRCGLTVANMNLDPLVCLLDGEETAAFVQGVRESCRIAQQLGCKRIATPVDRVNWGPGQPWYSSLGDERQRALRRRQQDNVVQALKEAARVAEDEGNTLLLEPLNTLYDHQDYFIVTSQQAFEIVQEVNSPAVRLLFDIYLQQITEGNLINNITDHIDLIGHLHVADVPGRHEPGTGEINFLNVLSAAKRAGYDGYVGLEYTPSGDAKASLELVSQIINQVNRG
jgi:hydroxypyruvate isomerase